MLKDALRALVYKLFHTTFYVKKIQLIVLIVFYIFYESGV